MGDPDRPNKITESIQKHHQETIDNAVDHEKIKTGHIRKGESEKETNKQQREREKQKLIKKQNLEQQEAMAGANRRIDSAAKSKSREPLFESKFKDDNLNTGQKINTNFGSKIEKRIKSFEVRSKKNDSSKFDKFSDRFNDDDDF